MGYSIAQFFDFIKVVPPAKPILLVGETGIGKSTIVKLAAETVFKMDYVPIVCSSNGEIVNLTGLPDVTKDYTDYKPFPWYKRGTDQVFLLDEINRNEAIIDAAIELATDRHLGNMTLTPNSRVFAAMNPSFNSRYRVAEMDYAHESRFAVVELEPTVDEWILLAQKANIYPAIINYIASNRCDLDPLSNDDNVSDAKGRYYHNLLPTRRGWYTLSEVLYNIEKFNDGKSKNPVNRASPLLFSDAYQFLEGAACSHVGLAAGKRFAKFYFNGEPVITPQKLLEGSDSDWKRTFPDLIEKMCQTDGTAMGELIDGMSHYLDGITPQLYNERQDGPSALAVKYGINLYKFVYSCAPAFQESFYKIGVRSTKVTNNKWPNLLCMGNPKLNALLREVVKNITERKHSK